MTDRGAAAFVGEALDTAVLLLAVRGEHADRLLVARAHILQEHAILRTLRTGKRRFDFAKVKLERRAVFGVRRRRVVPEALRFRVRLDERDLLRVASRKSQVMDRFGIDRKDPAGRAVLGRHVADRRAIGEREMRETVAEEFDELADHAVLAQHLRHGQDEIGRGRAFRQAAGQLEADDLRDEHRRRLPEHRGFGFDTADAPAEHADTVDHRRVRIGAEHGVRVRMPFAVFFRRHHDAREVFEVDLMHDAGARRHDLEVVEGLLAPAQKAVALAVALEFDLDVEIKRLGLAERIDLHGMVDHELCRRKRVDLVRIAAEFFHRIAHRGEIDDARHAGEILQHDACRHERDFGVGFLLRVPVRDRLDFLRRDIRAVLVAQQILEQDLHRIGQALEIETLAELGEAADLVVRAVDLEDVPGRKRVVHSMVLLASFTRALRAAAFRGTEAGVSPLLSPIWLLSCDSSRCLAVA